jgi:hypothetical protein
VFIWYSYGDVCIGLLSNKKIVIFQDAKEVVMDEPHRGPTDAHVHFPSSHRQTSHITTLPSQQLLGISKASNEAIVSQRNESINEVRKFPLEALVTS